MKIALSVADMSVGGIGPLSSNLSQALCQAGRQRAHHHVDIASILHHQHGRLHLGTGKRVLDRMGHEELLARNGYDALLHRLQ